MGLVLVVQLKQNTVIKVYFDNLEDSVMLYMWLRCYGNKNGCKRQYSCE